MSPSGEASGCQRPAIQIGCSVMLILPIRVTLVAGHLVFEDCVPDLNPHHVVGRQAEAVRRDDAGASHQEDSLGEAELPTQKASELAERAFHLRAARFALEDDRAAAADRHAYGYVRQRALGRDVDRPAERAAAVVDL